jgi:xanthine/uracil permease
MISIFAQNNGVIALTRCANRKAGFVCASFLILYGVLGKLSGVFLSIPNAVLGGVTTFLFGSVIAAGIKVLSYMKFTRKDRFVLAAAASFGFGNMLVPKWATYLFERVESPGSGLQGLFNSIIIVLSTPCTSRSSVAWSQLTSRFDRWSCGGYFELDYTRRRARGRRYRAQSIFPRLSA